MITFECSPFLRCIETATQVGKELGLKECTFNYYCGEWLADWIYKDGNNPVPKMSSQTRSIDDINKEFEQYGVTFKDEDAKGKRCSTLLSSLKLSKLLSTA